MPTAEGGRAGEGDWAIEADGLERWFGAVAAIAGVSLRIRRGEFFSLLGPSGCGKTTLLRLIAGLDSPDAGTLRIGGQDAAGVPAHKRPVNTVFQSYALFPHLSVWDNVAFGLRMKKTPAAAVTERVARVLALVEIAELARRRPAQLSGGQKQRVARARAVDNVPAVLLLDEPLGALDLKLRQQLQVELHQLQRRLGITFVYVTHDQEEALVMSDRIAVMNAGRLEQLDAAAALYERPRTRFVAQFLGACNLLPGKVVSALALEPAPGPALLVETALGPLRVLLGQAGRPWQPGEAVTLAIRPEKIRLAAPAGESANRVRATIEDVVYCGAETRYRLRAGEGAFNAVALNAGGEREGLRVGGVVACELVAEALVVLED